MQLNNEGHVNEINDLRSGLEEADMRIIPHIHWDVIKYSRKCLTVISEDTDVVVLLLYYFNVFSAREFKNCLLDFVRVTEKDVADTHDIF